MDPLMMCINRGCGWFGPASQAIDESEFQDQWLPRCPTCCAIVAYVPADLADAWRVREELQAFARGMISVSIMHPDATAAGTIRQIGAGLHDILRSEQAEKEE